MPRKLLIRSEILPYHVIARAHNKEPFPLPINQVWGLAQDSFLEASRIHPINLISFVLMSNHYHILLFTPHGNLDQFMYEFNKRLALKIKFEAGVINQIFEGRYKWCLIQSQQYFSNCYRYVYQNPVRAKIVKRCESYAFSTLQSAIGQGGFAIPIHDKFGFKDDYILNWLNTNIEEEELSALKKNYILQALTKNPPRNEPKPFPNSSFASTIAVNPIFPGIPTI